MIRIPQHIVRNKRSCLANLLCSFNDVLRKLDETRVIDMICHDFYKAFDKVHYKRLIKKVKSCGITDDSLMWLEDWYFREKIACCN